MKVFGKKGLGNTLKIFLEIVFICIIIFMVVTPFISTKIFLFYPNIICLLIIIYEFIGLFNSLKEDNPFCENTVKILKYASITSGVCSVVWLLQFVYEMVLVKYTDVFSIIILAFMFILFAGVSIALYLEKELFSKAKTYKEENDLTI